MIDDGTVIRGDDESAAWCGQGLPSPGPDEESASVRFQPGILIFSRRRHVLHMNRRALELTGQLDQADTGPAMMSRSKPVSDLRMQIQDILDSRKEADIWELFELKRVVYDGGRKILVRGFGLADRDSHDDSRIVIVLEEVDIGREHKVPRVPAPRRTKKMDIRRAHQTGRGNCSIA